MLKSVSEAIPPDSIETNCLYGLRRLSSLLSEFCNCKEPLSFRGSKLDCFREAATAKGDACFLFGLFKLRIEIGFGQGSLCLNFMHSLRGCLNRFKSGEPRVESAADTELEELFSELELLCWYAFSVNYSRSLSDAFTS